MNKNCFEKKKSRDEVICLDRTKIRAASRAVKKLVNAIMDESLTPEQQVWVLRLSVQHPKIKRISASAGVVAGWSGNLDSYIVTNIRATIAATRAP